MSLNHEFILISTLKKDILEDFQFYLNLVDKKNVSDICTISNSVCLHDDMISYFYDTFSWIYSKTLNNPNITNGINRYGITLFNNDSYATFYEVISGWIRLFSVAPEDMSLKGDFSYSDNNMGNYENLHINKMDILDKLNALQNMILFLKEENYYIIHLGI